MKKKPIGIDVRKSVVLILLFAFVLSISCAHYHKIQAESLALQGYLKVGDTVRIKTRDGRNLRLKIVEISDEALVGHNLDLGNPSLLHQAEALSSTQQTVLLEEITSLERKEISTGRAVGLVAGSLIGILSLSLLYVYIALGNDSES